MNDESYNFLNSIVNIAEIIENNHLFSSGLIKIDPNILIKIKTDLQKYQPIVNSETNITTTKTIEFYTGSIIKLLEEKYQSLSDESFRNIVKPFILKKLSVKITPKEGFHSIIGKIVLSFQKFTLEQMEELLIEFRHTFDNSNSSNTEKENSNTVTSKKVAKPKVVKRKTPSTFDAWKMATHPDDNIE